MSLLKNNLKYIQELSNNGDKLNKNNISKNNKDNVNINCFIDENSSVMDNKRLQLRAFIFDLVFTNYSLEQAYIYKPEKLMKVLVNDIKNIHLISTIKLMSFFIKANVFNLFIVTNVCERIAFGMPSVIRSSLQEEVWSSKDALLQPFIC